MYAFRGCPRSAESLPTIAGMRKQGDGVVFYGGFVEVSHFVASVYCNNAETSWKGANLSGKHSKLGSSR